ncbi:MAG: cadherin-like beta sandwich domain-containing protein [Erysipelotrichaceae bacterium]
MINITRTDPRSTNNFLSAITLSAGTIVFNKDTGNYSVVVENNVTSITIGATVADAKSTLTGPGTFDLKVYSNVFTLSVKAENGTVRNYTVDIVRKDELGFSKELSNDNALATLTIEGIDLAFKPEITNYVLNVDTALTSVKINATVRNTAAKAEFPATATLDFGQNVINVTVTAENGEKRIYALFIYRKSEAPIVSIDDILTTMDTTTAKTIILIPGISGVIPKEVLDKAAQKGIVLIVEKRDDLGRVIYIWTFTGVATDTRTNINTNLSFASPDAETILGLANYADGLILNFSHSGVIAPGTKIKIYVGAQFEDGMKLNLYLYVKVKGKLNISVKEVVVLKGFVELDMTHASEYFLTRSTIKNTTADPVFFLATVVEAGLIMSLLLFMFLRRRRKTA